MSLDDLKREAREATRREKMETGRLIERWTEKLASGNGHTTFPKAQEPRMSQAERDQLRRDLEAAGCEIRPGSFTDRLLRRDGA